MTKSFWWIVAFITLIQLIVLINPGHTFNDAVVIAAFALAGDVTSHKLWKTELFNMAQITFIWISSVLIGLCGMVVLHQAFF